MPTRLLLDGDDLPELMLRIRAEMGPHARVVKAERIRSGGFAGFFAREHYELTVEVPDGPPPSPAGAVRERRPPRTAGLDALVAAADAGDEGGVDTRTDVGQVDGGPADGGPGHGPATPAEPPVSTASDSFAQVLASVRAMVGQGETPGVPVTVAPEDGTAGAGTPAEPVAFSFPRIERGTGERGAAAADAPTKAPSDDPEVPVPAAPAPTPEEKGRSGSAATAADLLELGVPARLLEGFAGLTDPVPLSILLRRFARPPAVRLEPGVTVAVVGHADLALRTASQMAARAGLDGRDVLLAGEIDSVAGHGRRLLTVAAASRHRSRRRTDAPTVVALGVGSAAGAREEAARLLAALAPEQAWGAVDAGLRAADLRRWVRGVGAHRELDALAVVGADRAQAPGVVLDVGTPVGWVDGLPATPLVWAALLSERLAEDADWD